MNTLYKDGVVPFVDNWDDVDLVLKKDNKVWQGIIDYVKSATEYGKGKFLVSMLDLHSNMDCLSAIRGPQNLCMDILDYPEEIVNALTKVNSIYKKVFNKIYEVGDMKERGCIGWAPTYSEGKFAVVQCDFGVMVSPGQARRFIIPAIEEEASYLDNCVYHYDGKDALGHFDDVMAIEDIDVVQWVPGAGQPRSVEWMELLKKIQKADKGLWIYDWTIDEIKQYYKELNPEGLVFQVSADTKEEAEDLIAWLKNNT